MKTLLLQRLTFLAVLPLCTMIAIAAAHAAAPPAIPDTPAHTAAPSSSPDETAPATPLPDGTHDSTDWQDNADSRDRVDRHDRSGWRARHGRHGHGNELVNIGHDSNLPRGQTADSVVSIFGSSTSDGEAGNVVSVLGDTRVTGPSSDGAVAVLGNVYVDGKVDGDAVAVLGNMELGPHAQIDGNVVAIGGALQRDPAAIVRGNVQSIFGSFGSVGWLRSWIHHCLLYGRPLALAPGLGWAWGLAFACLALYAALALLFREGLTRCVQTFEAQPGQSVLAALITMLLTPVLVVLLCVTVIGIAAVPFVVFGLLCAGLFGKAVMLAWLGQRVTGRQGTGALSHPAVAVLIGGVLVLALYL
ncbi:MAG TPA: polymer-forming cytoskeletal protein, partial [Steroidobacteraceae bacterium]